MLEFGVGLVLVFARNVSQQFTINTIIIMAISETDIKKKSLKKKVSNALKINK